MTANAHSKLAQQMDAYLSWWKEAGVDYAYEEEPRQWLEPSDAPDTATGGDGHAGKGKPSKGGARRAGPQANKGKSSASGYRPGQARQATPNDKPLGGPVDQWPQELDQFAPWWLSTKPLGEGGLYQRVPPRGPKHARLMVLVGEPEACDKEQLLSGPEGQLLEKFLKAASIAPEQTYFASALPRHTPLPDWPELKARGLGKILHHHIKLAAPKRIISFGRNIPSLLNHEPTQDYPNLSKIYQDDALIPLLTSKSIAALLASPAMRRNLWNSWLKEMDQVYGETS